MSPAFRIHGENPKLFRYRGRPLVLITATEHYGAVMNRPFDYERYLEDAAAHGMTVTRLFTLFRELQSACNPYSTCKPESVDYVAPYARSGGGRALDLQPRYDLDEANPEFYSRLHGFLARAGELGIVVELVLFSHSYTPEVWSLNPLNAANNVNGLEAIPWYEYTTQRHPKLLARQVVHARRMVNEASRHDHVFIEVCNEPGGNLPVEGAPSSDEVNEWLAAMLQVVRAEMTKLGRKQVIAGQEAFAYKLQGEEVNELDVHQFADLSFGHLSYDVVNMHPLSNMKYRGKQYNLGRFMVGELRLRELRKYCLDLYKAPKPLNLDEDNAATQYRDRFGWTIHRKRAWVSVLCGAHYDMIDFTILNGRETGTPESAAGLRAPMGFLARYIHSMDLVRSRPLPEASPVDPPDCVTVCFGVAGEDYLVYVADAREGASYEPEALEGLALELVLPGGLYRVEYVRPLKMKLEPGPEFESEGGHTLDLPPFTDDLALRIRAVGSEE